MASWKGCGRKLAYRGAAAAMALTLGLAPVPYVTYRALAATSTDATVASWDASYDGQSYVFTIVSANGAASINKWIGVTYADGSTGNNNAIQLTWDCSEVKGGWYQDIPGATASVLGDVVTVSVPASYFGDKDFTVSYCGSTMTSAQMGGPSAGSGSGSGSADAGEKPATKPEGDAGSAPGGSGSSSGSDAGTEPSEPAAPEPTEPTPAPDQKEDAPGSSTDAPAGAYTGIAIDGDFSDWDGVAKTDVNEGKGWHTVDRMAMVWDGDWVYLYFETEDNNYSSVCGAGDYGNGQYAITTDLGNQTLVQLQPGPTVAGVDGARVAVSSTDWGKPPYKWEVAIPASKLGAYSKTISFGIYGKDPAITDVANLKAGSADAGDTDRTFDGITYDGSYDDWTYYPHATIEYATAGTQENVVDSRAALYAEKDKLYGHVETTMPAHVSAAGGDLTQGISLKVNDDENLMLTPRLIAVDSAGNIDWHPQTSGLADGTYEFYLASSTTNGTSANVNDLRDDDVIYGRLMLTVSGQRNEMEYEIDVPTLAAHLHANWGQSKEETSIDPNSIMKFSAQYGRLGQQWVTTAGTSTAPLVGVGLCLAVVGGTYARRRRRQA